MKFDDLRLEEPILRAVLAEGYSVPTPIQTKAIPHVLEGRDLLGCAQTGTGKTAAFALPILQRLGQTRTVPARQARPVRVLVLAPTRELAAQIGESFRSYGRYTPFRHTVIFGGVGQNPQVRALRDGVEILVATPGRLLDLMQQGFVDLSRIEVLVLDEADRMLDMGFIRDIRKIVAKVPAKRQTLLFSATMPADIRDLANAILTRPVYVEVAPVSSTAELIQQSVYFVEKRNKPAMLQHFLNNNPVGRALVFTRTKHGADLVARHLARAGIEAEAIHGNKSQNARVRAMNRFKSDSPPVLVATDIAARGLDIDEVSHVINYDLPNIPETYVHRIGRTGRAGASGLAVSFCDDLERPFLRDIERLIRRTIPVNSERPKLPAAPARETSRSPRRQPASAPAPVAKPTARTDTRSPQPDARDLQSVQARTPNPPARAPQETREEAAPPKTGWLMRVRSGRSVGRRGARARRPVASSVR